MELRFDLGIRDKELANPPPPPLVNEAIASQHPRSTPLVISSILSFPVSFHHTAISNANVCLPGTQQLDSIHHLTSPHFVTIVSPNRNQIRNTAVSTTTLKQHNLVLQPITWQTSSYVHLPHPPPSFDLPLTTSTGTLQRRSAHLPRASPL